MSKKIKPSMTLNQALDTCLNIAEKRLENAINKNKEWDINHYKNDIKIIKEQLAEINPQA